MCASIVTNFTNQSCQTKKITKGTQCICDYINDVALLPKYVPPTQLAVIPPKLELATMHEHLFGRVVVL